MLERIHLFLQLPLNLLSHALGIINLCDYEPGVGSSGIYLSNPLEADLACSNGIRLTLSETR